MLPVDESLESGFEGAFTCHQRMDVPQRSPRIPMAEPEDTESLPTQPLTGPSPAIGRDAVAPCPAPGPSPRAGIWQPPTPEEVQPSFALYEIRGLLGRGGMGAGILDGGRAKQSRYA